MVEPPPGVSSTVELAAHGLDEARGRRPGRGPTPGAVGLSPSRWNGSKTRSGVRRAMPGPWSMTRRSTRPPTAPASTRTGSPGGSEPQGVGDQVGDGPLEQGRVGLRPAGASRARRRRRRGLGRPRLAEARRRRPPRGRRRRRRHDERAGLEAAHVEQVADEAVEPVGLLVDGDEERSRCVVGPGDVVLEQARHRRLDRRERRAQVVATRAEQRGAQVVAPRPAPRPARPRPAAAGVSRAAASWAAKAPSTRWSSRPGRSVAGEHELDARRQRRAASVAGRRRPGRRRRPRPGPRRWRSVRTSRRLRRGRTVLRRLVEQLRERVVLAQQRARQRRPAPRPRPGPARPRRRVAPPTSTSTLTTTATSEEDDEGERGSRPRRW